MPERIVWNPDDPAASLAPAARHLAAGRLALLPTESTYELAAAALDPDAVMRLQALAGPGDPPALVLADAKEANDWLPGLSGPAERLLRKVGPGPWKLRADGGATRGLLARLPEAVRRVVCPDDKHVTLRLPEHPAWPWAARLLKGPLVSVGTEPPITSAEQMPETLGEQVALVVDAGTSPIGQPPSVLRSTGRHWQLERAGSVPAETLEEVLLFRILFICTGNTCRSPMAEVLCTQLLAERLGCPPDELPRHGFRVQSAGLAAMMGGGAAQEALATVRELGADLTRHRSQPLTFELLALADRVYTMTASHLRMLQSAGGAGLPAAELLSPEGRDVADPIGGELAVYQACAREIVDCLRRRLSEL